MPQVQCTKCKATTVNLNIKASKPSSKKVSVLPAADFLMITWTAAETAAMALVFGGGQYKFNSPKSTNFTPLLFNGLHAPAQATNHGYFFRATVNGKSIICLKSEFHPKVQPAETTIFFEKLAGPKSSPNFKYIVTSGTAGGIWATLDLGDVVVSNKARFGMTMTAEQQALMFTGVTDVIGSGAPAGFANWYDYANSQILKNDACVNSGLVSQGGRQTTSPVPAIYYKASGSNLICVCTNSRISDDECGRIATYRTLGATLDENDAYVAQALNAVDYSNWISIRNVSDLPCAASSDDQYDRFGQCSSINGAYAAWAFVMGH